jgi:hypothetical protein
MIGQDLPNPVESAIQAERAIEYHGLAHKP